MTYAGTGFTWIDGVIVVVYLIAVIAAGLSVRRYVGNVEHFLLAGRDVRLYLGIASLAATEFGIVTCMSASELGYRYGFAGVTPGILLAIAMFVVGRTGFCIRRLREHGCLTIPELFEERFGKRVRWLSGVVIVLGGLLNMGVFLRKGGEFLIHVVGLNPAYLELTMTALLLIVAIYTILGGMLSVLVTDFLQFVVMATGLLAVSALLLHKVGWTALTQVVEDKLGAAGFNPFLNPEMGWEYIVFNFLVMMAVVLTWQTMVQRVLAAKDAKTGQKMYTRTSFFFICRFLIPGLWGIAALALLAPAAVGDEPILAMPRLLAAVVPMGLMGLLVASMLAADMSTNSSYLLTWGSVIYNDILGPIHKNRWSERKGLLVNRLIVGLIGVFLLVYGLWYELKGDLWTYMAVTGTIYLAAMSVLLIACCYYRRANSWGAMSAIMLGAAVPIGFLILQQLPATAGLASAIGPSRSGIATFALVTLSMIVGSEFKRVVERRRAA